MTSIKLSELGTNKIAYTECIQAHLLSTSSIHFTQPSVMPTQRRDSNKFRGAVIVMQPKMTTAHKQYCKRMSAVYPQCMPSLPNYILTYLI